MQEAETLVTARIFLDTRTMPTTTSPSTRPVTPITPLPVARPAVAAPGPPDPEDSLDPLGMALSTAGMAAGLYHGYRRNQSLGWSLVWGVLGAAVPIPTTVIAVAQGFGQPRANPTRTLDDRSRALLGLGPRL